ncbi:MAG: helix-turn-helix domain-containing protein [Acidimicrobiia bacterium]|nr:helix-turn-helix domain-containing protein [Acidimicrobiia bacterium]
MPRPSPQTDRVVTLIGLLAASPDRHLTLAEVTRRLGVNKSTCHAILSALTEAGWLLRDPRRKTYRLGPALIGIGRQAAAGFPALEFARSAIAQLSLELHLHCAVLDVKDDVTTVLDQVRDPAARGIGLHPGASYPLQPPFGAVVVAWSEPEVVEAWLGHTAPERRPGHRAALAAIRRRGFVVELAPPSAAGYRRLLTELDQRLPGPLADGRRVEEVLSELAALADEERYLPTDLLDDAVYRLNDVNAPMFGADGSVVLVITLSGFTTPQTGRQVRAVGERLVRATTELNRALRHIA